MKMKIILILSMILLCSCSYNQAITPKQKLYGAISDYKQSQKIALMYKDSCDSGILYDVDCKDKVQRIIKINKRANTLIQSLDTKSIDVSYNNSILSALGFITVELKTYLIKLKGDKNES